MPAAAMRAGTPTGCYPDPVRFGRLRSLFQRLIPLSRGGAAASRAPLDAGPPQQEDPSASAVDPGDEGAVRLGPSDTLDLHTFLPKDVASVVGEFLDAAASSGIPRVRIIHGKGIGVQRAIVRSILERRSCVASFSDAPDASGWGATIAILRPNNP